MTKVASLVARFAHEEDGASIAEYLVLLGVVAGVLVTAIAGFSRALAGAFNTWATWITTHATPA
jgi:Flp pilus assembly pilin Flp